MLTISASSRNLMFSAKFQDKKIYTKNITIRVFFQGQVLHCMRRNLGCSSAKGRSSTANSETKAGVLPGIE